MLETYARVLAISKKMDDWEGQGRFRKNIGLLQVRSECYEESLQCLKAACGTFVELGKLLRAAEQWGNIGSVYRDMNRYQKAIQSYERSLPLFESIDHREGIADQYTNIAYIHVMNNRPEETRAELKAGFIRQNLENLERIAG